MIRPTDFLNHHERSWAFEQDWISLAFASNGMRENLEHEHIFWAVYASVSVYYQYDKVIVNLQ